MTRMEENGRDGKGRGQERRDRMKRREGRGEARGGREDNVAPH